MVTFLALREFRVIFTMKTSSVSENNKVGCVQFNLFLDPGQNRKQTQQTPWSVSGPPYYSLLQSAWDTEAYSFPDAYGPGKKYGWKEGGML